MEQKQQKIQEPLITHDIELKNRKDLHITGVLEVVSATSGLINLKTSAGLLIVGGSDLKIKNLLETEKKVDIEGLINEIKYNEKKKKLFEKVFK